MKVVKGNLLTLAKEGNFDLIIHGANCFHKMGSGIAAQIAKEFPQAVVSDNCTLYGSPFKLGTFSFAHAANIASTPVYFQIINLYTQFLPGRNFEYSALIKGLDALKNAYILDKKSIGVPWIGCGIGGGDRQVVETILKHWETQSNVSLTVVEFP